MAINIHKIYDRRRIWKIAFFVVSLFLVVAFILISNNLVDDVAVQERERMQIWADATKELTTVNSSGMNTDVDFLFSIIESNHSIPVLLVDDHGNILLHRNFKLPEPIDSLSPYEISPANKAFLQGAVGGASNIVTTAIIGTLLCVAYAATKPKKGSLKEEE